ncbi:MAG: hypothetical protein GYA63_11560 [Armatimonadetes bacterium]|nr:hypothetical protein [Armatimonadota bacterium]
MQITLSFPSARSGGKAIRIDPPPKLRSMQRSAMSRSRNCSVRISVRTSPRFFFERRVLPDALQVFVQLGTKLRPLCSREGRVDDLEQSRKITVVRLHTIKPEEFGCGIKAGNELRTFAS